MTNVAQITAILNTPSYDDEPLVVIRDDLTGGTNTKMHARSIGDNQAKTLNNVNIEIPGERRKRPGSVTIANIPTSGAIPLSGSTFKTLNTFKIQGYNDQLLGYLGNKIWKSEDEGNWECVLSGGVTLYSGAIPLLSGAINLSGTRLGMAFGKQSGLAPDDVAMMCDLRANVILMTAANNFQDLGDTNTSPPKTDVITWYMNRFWGLKNDLLYFSNAYASNYSTAFDRTSQVFRIPVGEERCLIGTRYLGLIVGGKEAIWSLSPSVTPVATDKPEPLIANKGIVSKDGVVVAGDDIFFFADDGLRSLTRTVQDQLQQKTSFPLSYRLKDEFNRILWSSIEELHMEVFDNKLFISVPIIGGGWDVWIYFIALDSFTVMRNVSPQCATTHRVNGEERFYYGKEGYGRVYRAWYGLTDEGTTQYDGTAIEYTEEGRQENFGQPLTYKSGGELEIEAAACDSDAYLSVYISVDDGAYQLMGTMYLPGLTQLPQTLPFTLQSLNIQRKKFHLDKYGEFRQIQIKIIENSQNSELIKIYSTNLTTYSAKLNTEEKGN